MDEKAFVAVFGERLEALEGLKAFNDYRKFISNPANNLVVDQYASYLRMAVLQSSETNQKAFKELLKNKQASGDITSETFQELEKFFSTTRPDQIPEKLKPYLSELANGNQEIKEKLIEFMPGIQDPFSLPPPILHLHSLCEHYFAVQKLAFEETLRTPVIEKMYKDSQEKIKQDLNQMLMKVNKIDEQSNSRYYLYHEQSGLLPKSYASYSEAAKAADESYRVAEAVIADGGSVSLPEGRLYLVEVSDRDEINKKSTTLLSNMLQSGADKEEQKSLDWPSFLRSVQQIKTVRGGELSQEKHKIQVNPLYEGILINHAIKQIQSLIDGLENNRFLKLIDWMKSKFGISNGDTTQKKVEYLKKLRDLLKTELDKPVESQRTVAAILTAWKEEDADRMKVLNKPRAFSIFSETHTAKVFKQIETESEQQNLSSSDFIAYQTGLPTFSNVKEDITSYHSDHLPLLSQVPLADKSFVKIVSWNIEGGDSGSGFSDGGVNKDVDRIGETAEQIIKRFEKNLDALEIISKKHQPDIICLQEAPIALASNSNSSQYEFQIEKLDKTKVKFEAPKGYILMESKGDTATLFSEGFLKKYDVEYDKVKKSWKCTSKDNRNVINVYNEHMGYQLNSVKVEKQIQEKLEKGLEESNSSISYTHAVVGDFNGFEIPVSDDRPQNLTETVVGGMCTKNQIQGSNSVSGAYMAHKSEHGTSSVQLQRTLIDPSTGEFIADNPPLDIFKMPLSQREEVERVRPALCIDDKYKIQKIINNQTIFQYEQELRNKLGMQSPMELRANPKESEKMKYYNALDAQLFVRLGSDINNGRSLIFVLPEKNANCIGFFLGLKGILGDEKDILFQRQEDWFKNKDHPELLNYQISVPLDKVDRFHQAVEKYFNPQVENTFKSGM